jgi:dihydrofolate reductase
MHIIVAMTPSRGIGLNGCIPWPIIPDDMRHFQTLTIGQTVIMGRKTWDSLPLGKRPLPNRNNVVLTGGNMDSVMRDPKNKDAWIIGGSEIYAKALSSEYRDLIDTIHVTIVHGDSHPECDVFFCDVDDSVFELRHRIKRGLGTHEFLCYVRRGVKLNHLRINDHYKSMNFFL